MYTMNHCAYLCKDVYTEKDKSMNLKSNRRHFSSHSTPNVLPSKHVIFDGIDDENPTPTPQQINHHNKHIQNGYKPPNIPNMTQTKSRNSRSSKYGMDDEDDNMGNVSMKDINKRRKKKKKNTLSSHNGYHHNTDSRKSGTNHTMISRSEDTMLSHSSDDDSSITRSSVTRSSLSDSSDMGIMGHIKHISDHQLHTQMKYNDSTNSITMNIGRRRSFMDSTHNKENSLTHTFKNYHRHKQTESASLSTAALNKRRKSASHKLNSRRTSAILGHSLALIPDKKQSASSVKSNVTYSASKASTKESGSGQSSNLSPNKLPLNTIVTQQQKQKSKKRKYKPFKKRNSESLSSDYIKMEHANSTRVTQKERINKYKEMGISVNSVGFKYNPKTEKFKSKTPTTTYLSSSALRAAKKAKVVGGGYGNETIDEPNIPTHLRSYYAIIKDLNKLKASTKKKQHRTQLDAINSKLHTLFFANERTNIPNLAAFQKFFLDRMSVKSVHKDLDWHICLLRPKIHSRLQDAQIDSVINVVADLLRKCVKKFNNKRGHLTSAANTNRIGVGTYGGGKDKNQIQSAFILSNKPSSSVPPEFYKSKSSPTSPLGHFVKNRFGKNGNHVQTPSDDSNFLSNGHKPNFLNIDDANYASSADSAGQSPSFAPSQYSDSDNSIISLTDRLFSHKKEYDVMTPPASVQLKQEIKKSKKEKQKQNHTRLLSFATLAKKKKKDRDKSKHHKGTESMSRPNMSTQEIVALTGLPGAKKVKGSDHHNVDEPYPMELFHISDMNFVLVYYVKFLTKFEQLIVEFLTLYQEYSNRSDDMESDVPLQLSLVASNPRETYMESMLKAHNTMTWGRQSREHPWIKVQTDRRKSQKFGQDLIYMVKYMKENDIEALHEIMKQAPDLNTKDRETQKTVLQIALDKSKQQPSFAFIARYLALKQLLFSQRIQDESIMTQALETDNPMVAEILLHLEPNLDSKSSLSNKSCLDLAYHSNLKNLALYMSKLNVPSWHNLQLIRRWVSACSIGDVVKLRSVLQRGFNIDYFDKNDMQKTALIICTQKRYKECVEFLLKNGCNVDARDNSQKTALHYAAINLDGEIFRMILEKRANWSIKDLDNKTAIKYVMEQIGFVPERKKENQLKLTKILTNASSVNDMYRHDNNRFWRINDDDFDGDGNDSDGNDSWDEFGYLVDAISSNDEESDVDSDNDDKKEDENNGKHHYKPVDIQQVVKILDIACQAAIPMDSRLFLLAVQRNWPHIILVLCSKRAKLNIDVVGKDGITPLMLAAREGKKACLNALLQSGSPDLDLTDASDRAAIMHAAYRGEAECVERLIKAGAAVDMETVDGTTLLMASCYGGLEEFAKYLLDEGGADVNAVNENGFSALLFAASEGYGDIVSLLLNHSASIDIVSRGGTTPLMAACSGGLHEFLLYVMARINRGDMNVTDENGWTALMHSVTAGAEKCAALLLKAEASVVTVSDDGNSLLSLVIMANLVWMVRHIMTAIIKQINNSNKTDIYNMLNTREHGNGFSCIHEACGIGADKCLSLLIEYNDKIVEEYGDMIQFGLPDLSARTPLMIACLNGHKKCVDLLLNNENGNINVEKCDHEGHSALIYAIESGEMSIVKALALHPVHSKKFPKKTVQQAKQAAMQRGYKQMYQVLATIGNNDDD